MTRLFIFGALALSLTLASSVANAHDDHAASFLLGTAVGSTLQHHRDARHGYLNQRHSYQHRRQIHRWRAMQRRQRLHLAAHHDHRACAVPNRYDGGRRAYRSDSEWDVSRHYTRRHYRDQARRR